MRDVEKFISPFVESQFPSFYREEGPQFIAFTKAYFEWMESSNNVLYQTRRLPSYKDIDTTVDDFLIQFKEKYLKNIQFDTATNKQLLVKNSLDLYRSKGTERSIDLFFKLVYGTSAEVRYPADNILRVSDGIWERPEYLEIAYNKNNVDYVGKQIIGAISGAKAFVEKYIRRKAGAGYVDLLYISGVQGSFVNGELIGLNINNVPVYDRSKRSQLIGSVNRVIIQDRGRDFRVGDLVTLVSDIDGKGGIARVAAVSEATGLVDFLFIDGGYGYTLSADSIVSEKVLSLENVVANTKGDQYFKLFEQAVQPIIDVEFTSASDNLAVGNTVFRYAANGQLSGSGVIIDIDQSGTTGTATISHVNGCFTNSTYYTVSNAISFSGDTVEDRSIGGKVMGIPNTYTLTTKSHNNTLSVGDVVIQKNTSDIFARGTVSSISAEQTANLVILTNATGAFKVGTRFENENDSSISANVTNVNLTAGIYEIRNFINTLQYSTANNDELPYSSRIYRYNNKGKKIAEGLLLTISHDSGTATGNLTYIPISGYFTETETFYSGSNTSRAVVVTSTTSNSGGDYIPSQYSKILTTVTNTYATLVRTSFGSGAAFNIGTIGDTEDIFIGTDLIGSNNVGYLDYDRVILTVGSESGFTVGDSVYQEINKIAFNANSSVDASTGFITLPSADSLYTVGDIVKYQVDAGNTALNGLISNDYYYVALANTTGVILAYPYRKTDDISNTNYVDFANNKVDEVGHYLYKVAHGTVFETATGVIRTKDNHNYFGNTGGTANVTDFANSNLIVYENTTTNTSISAISAYTTLTIANTPYASLAISSSALGFPKNPQGDAKNTIYSCLSFNKFTLGSIGTLSGRDPGADYNVDPYVLAYQPYIASFNRKDYVLNIGNLTGGFTVGEKINQTLANLVYYDLKVDAGAYSNTFDEKVVSVNSADEVDGTNEFIYYRANSSVFNATDNVNSNTDFIEIANANIIYSKNNYVRYYTTSGNTALSGISNNSFYFISFANSTGICLSSTAGGANLNITQSSNVVTFHSNTSVDSSADFISIASANTYLANGDLVRYITKAGNTALTGLTNNQIYYVRYANSTGLALSLTSSGANVNITGLNPGDSGHVLRYYRANANGHNIVKYGNEYANNTRILYRVPTGNTVISGLANNTAYYVVSANSIGFKVSSTLGGSAINLTAAGSGETHTFSTIPGFLPGDRVYQNTTPKVNAVVQSIYTSGANNYVRVRGNTGTLTTSNLYSYSNPYVGANVATVSQYQITSTAKGIVKSANSSVLTVKRLTFETTFEPGSSIRGDVSGATANLVSFTEDPDVIYPIGVNAVIEANVITANGQVTSLQVIDSGINYANSEAVQYVSEDGERSGTAKIVIDGKGIGKGYYKSSKGFLSEDMYIHDGDYYQEYSYEILSKISVDKYADMFKKVMHTAGTKFFGSAQIIEEDSITLELAQISTGQEIKFNSQTDVSTVNETIDVDMTPNPFANGDQVLYYTGTANTRVGGLANNTTYYVVQTSGKYIKLSTTATGSPINITANATPGTHNYLLKTVEE